MLGISVVGAAVAGFYGIIHDQITYSISPEYFTRFKFLQFNYADFGLPARIHVAEIGFLATWWVGFICAWFLTRLAFPRLPRVFVVRYVLQSFAIIFASALAFGFFGFVLGSYRMRGGSLHSWDYWRVTFGIEDLRSFAIVGYIHNCGYLGALLGLVIAMLYLKRFKRSVTP